jgi:hypothetical protein
VPRSLHPSYTNSLGHSSSGTSVRWRAACRACPYRTPAASIPPPVVLGRRSLLCSGTTPGTSLLQWMSLLSSSREGRSSRHRLGRKQCDPPGCFHCLRLWRACSFRRRLWLGRSPHFSFAALGLASLSDSSAQLTAPSLTCCWVVSLASHSSIATLKRAKALRDGSALGRRLEEERSLLASRGSGNSPRGVRSQPADAERS